MNYISTANDYVFPIENIVNLYDYDGVKGPATIRNQLPADKQKAIHTVATRARAAFVVTNSDASETSATYAPEVIEAGLKFIGEHGMVGKFEANAPWEFHPNLTVDRRILPELESRAKELLIAAGMPWTQKGEDLQRGRRMIKVENKMASFALVRTMNGFHPAEKNALITEMNNVTNFVMHKLADEFKLEQEGWTKTVGADAQEFAQAGFSKRDGVIWLMDRCQITNDTRLVMHEDSNADLLEWLHREHNGINIGVGDKYHKPERPSHIFGSVADIEGFWRYQMTMSEQIESAGEVNFSRALKAATGNHP